MAKSKWDTAFKLNAVRLVQEEGLSQAQASRDVGVPESTLWRWIREVDAEGIESAFSGKRRSGKLKPKEEDEWVCGLCAIEGVSRLKKDKLKKILSLLSELLEIL
jgi:transposase